MNERAIINQIERYCKKKKLLCWKLNDRFNSGRPDLLIIGKSRHGVYIWLEVKTAKGELTKIQLHTLAILSMFGADVHIVRSLQEAKDILEKAGL